MKNMFSLKYRFFKQSSITTLQTFHNVNHGTSSSLNSTLENIEVSPFKHTHCSISFTNSARKEKTPTI